MRSLHGRLERADFGVDHAFGLARLNDEESDRRVPLPA
jgi:hypothetical protein